MPSPRSTVCVPKHLFLDDASARDENVPRMISHGYSSKYHAAPHAEQFISSCCTMLVKVQPKFCNICSKNQQETADFQLFLEIHVLVGFVDTGWFGLYMRNIGIYELVKRSMSIAYNTRKPVSSAPLNPHSEPVLVFLWGSVLWQFETLLSIQTRGGETVGWLRSYRSIACKNRDFEPYWVAAKSDLAAFAIVTVIFFQLPLFSLTRWQSRCFECTGLHSLFFSTHQYLLRNRRCDHSRSWL